MMIVNNRNRRDLTHDLILPTLLFAALGGMVWAIRGCSGFGAMKGCTFAGVTWGTAWWFIARDPIGPQSRRYSSAWIILALAAGIGISGGRGWMQWPGFFAGHIQLNQKEFADINPAYGFLWMFIAGMPWAGLGACVLAWTGPQRPVPPWQWVLRIGCGLGMGYFLSGYLFPKYPEIFLPFIPSSTLSTMIWKPTRICGGSWETTNPR